MASASRELIEWRPNYSVNVKSIDSQHQALVSIIRRLQEAMLQGKTNQVVVPLFTAMNQYAKFHFEYEEQLLEANGYPSLGSHRQEHAKLLAELKGLESKYVTGKLHAGAPLMQFLRTWLLDHICVHDKEYSVFFREKGIV